MILNKSRISKLSKIIFSMFLGITLHGPSMQVCKENPQSIVYDIRQCEVAQQEDGSSCGYHAFYNALVISRSIKDKSLNNLLHDREVINSFFGSSESEWVKHVILKRAKTLAKYYITDHLLKSLKHMEILSNEIEIDQNCYKLNLSENYIRLKNFGNSSECILSYLDKKREMFCNVISNVAQSLADNIIEEANYSYNIKTTLSYLFGNVKSYFSDRSSRFPKYFYDVKSDSIAEAFKIEFIRRGMSEEDACKMITRISKYVIEFTDVCFEIIADYQIKDLKTNETYVIDWVHRTDKDFIKLHDINHMSSVENTGHWLSSEEIDSIMQLEKEKKSDFSQDINVYCLERDIEQLFECDNNLMEARSNFKDKNYEGTSAFLIYSDSEKHWFTCVVTKNNGEDFPKFIFADSLGKNRIESRESLEFIRLLLLSEEVSEQDEVSENNSEYISSFDEQDLPGLDLLLEGNNLININVIIEQLKSKKLETTRGLILHGPPNTGKFTTACLMKVLSGWNLLAVEAEDFFNEAKHPDRKEYYNFIKEFFNKLQNFGPTIIFIHNISKDLVNKESISSNLLAIFLRELKIYNNKNLTFLILSTYYDELAQDGVFESFVLPIKFTLPNYFQRSAIFSYYIKKYCNEENCQTLLESSWFKSLEKTATSFYNPITKGDHNLLSTSAGFSPLDLKEISKKAVVGLSKNISNVTNSSFWSTYKNTFNFSKSTLLSGTKVVLLPLDLSMHLGIYYLRSSNLEHALLKFCEIQREQISNINRFYLNEDSIIPDPAKKVFCFLFNVASDTAKKKAEEKCEQVTKAVWDWTEIKFHNWLSNNIKFS